MRNNNILTNNFIDANLLPGFVNEYGQKLTPNRITEAKKRGRLAINGSTMIISNPDETKRFRFKIHEIFNFSDREKIV